MTNGAHAGSTTVRFGHRRAVILGTALSLVVTGTAMATDLLGAAADPGDLLAREGLQTPDSVTHGALDGLQYADPLEGLSLVDAPEAASDGGAHLDYPLLVPPGRGGMTPDLALSYDSGGDTGWVGQGWDLSLGEIEVDTTFGAPHFHATKESESYNLDGDLLVPDAFGGAAGWEPRSNGPRHDFTRQVETEYEQIIRHGNGPKTYFWEVRDADGGVRWYGGQPDVGGPDGDPAADADGNPPTLEENAVVRDKDDHIVRWLLSGQRDVGVNLIRYRYRTVDYKSENDEFTRLGAAESCTSGDDILCARHTYLSRIEYTAAAAASGAPADPAYRIDFLLQHDVTPGAAMRPDPVLDATGRYLDYMAERLERVVVTHGRTDGSGGRTYDEVAARYDFAYRTGPYGKTLLDAVTQGAGGSDSDPAVHTFVYYDEARDKNGTYHGFQPRQADGVPVRWGSADDLGDHAYLDENVSASILGGSTTNSAEGGAYIGFNPFIPQKMISAGGSFNVGGGRTDGIVEFLDLNGDALPDKVFKSSEGIRVRLNEGGANGTPGFGGKKTPGHLESLSGESFFNFTVAAEAYPVVSIAFGAGMSASWADTYFSDVNADGLPDLVAGGRVLFNRLVGGVPTFDKSSAQTFVPLGASAEPVQDLAAIQEIEDQLAAESPPVDSVRRWVAPYAGLVELSAPVTLDPEEFVAGTNDGVRVAVQHNGDELAATRLESKGATAFTDPLEVSVDAGDHLYFRVGASGDGANDEVTWAPAVTYVEVGGTPVIEASACVEDGAGGELPEECAEDSGVWQVPLDANGLSQIAFRADDDFTLAGRPGTNVGMPLQGTVEFTATVVKHAVTSDDLELVLTHNGAPVAGSAIVIDADATGEIPISGISFQVAAPPVPDPDDADTDDPASLPKPDLVHAHLAADSPVDLAAFSWNPAVHYTQAVDPAGDPVEVTRDGEHLIRMDLTPDVDIYPHRSGDRPGTPSEIDTDGPRHAVVTFDRTRPDVTSANRVPDGEAVLTVKTADGTLVAKEAFAVSETTSPGSPAWSPLTFEVPLGFTPEADTAYWVEVSIRDAALSGAVRLAPDATVDLVRVTDDEDEKDPVPVPVTMHWMGSQGIFPLAYRGWGSAGYTAADVLATSAMDEDAFVVDPADHPSEMPAEGDLGFEDVQGGGTVSQEPSHAYIPITEVPNVPGMPEPLAGPQWMGPRSSLAVTGERMRTSLLARDSVKLGVGTSTPSEGGRSGINRVAVTGPSLSLAAGLGPFGGSVGTGWSWGVQDYEDMNGDGFPDVLTPRHIQYTDQRGALKDSSELGDIAAVTNRSMTVSTDIGIAGGLVSVTSNAKGKTNATSGGSAGKGGTPSESGPGVDAVLGGGFNYSWTNPNTGSDLSQKPDTGEIKEAADEAALLPIEAEYADVNGDGLPDRVYANDHGVFVNYNLGYGFTKAAMKLAPSGFSMQESIGGSASIGFSMPYGDFSGGAAFNWNYDSSRTAWVDVNGDGILDRLYKPVAADAQPTVQFGTGTELGDPTTYGDWASTVGVGAANAGQGPHISYDRSGGVGGGFDFSVYIGPLCPPVCYLVINPGASYQNSASFSEVSLDDIDGDGLVDSLSSTDDNAIVPHLNTYGRTNLLKTVITPIGGSIALEYERDGNTVEHPDSVWTMSKVTLDDGRAGDGADKLASSFSYDDLRYDRLFRRPLGFATVVERELDAASGTVLRSTTRGFHNSSVFVAGLEKGLTVVEGTDGVKMRSVALDWRLRDVLAVGDGFDVSAPVSGLLEPADLEGIGLDGLGRSIAPLMVESQELYHGDGDVVAQRSRTTFTYDGLGNPVEEVDHGETENPADDRITTIEYSNCEISASDSLGCPDPATTNASPLWSAQGCPTWVSQPARVTVTDVDGTVHRYRDGSRDLCDNGAVTHLEERIDDDSIAVTDLDFDAYGSYDRIVYPEGSDGVRYAVQYTYDADRHTDVAAVTEYDLPPAAVAPFLEDGTIHADAREGLTSTATFDALSGRVASQTDANGHTTTYGYDYFGRLVSIGNPLDADLVTFEYHPSAADYGYAVARHDDPQADDPIETVQFVDGLGRVTQSKRDARVVTDSGQTVDGRIVSGAANFDHLGRIVEEYQPIVDTVALTAYEPGTSGADTVTTTEWDLWDLAVRTVEPGNRVTEVVYDYSDLDGVTMFSAAKTDPAGRVVTTYSTVRDTVMAHDDAPVDEEPRRMHYEYDVVGQLVRVLDTAGLETTHTYDLLGNRTSTTTPDGGLVELGYDQEGKLVSEQSPVLREADSRTTYSYEFRRLVGIDYPDATPDVSYEYGGMGAADNGAGRIVRSEDGSRIVTRKYDALGLVAEETAEMKLIGWRPDADNIEKYRWTTAWTHDALGRLNEVVYPDGERVSYGYDSGGNARTVAGEEDGFEQVAVIDPVTGEQAVDPVTGEPVFESVPTTFEYPYVDDRRYDVFLRQVGADLGNGVTTAWDFDRQTLWLNGIYSRSAGRNLPDGIGEEYRTVQDISYTYDAVGNPVTYTNDLNDPIAPLISGKTTQSYTYDGYGRIIAGRGNHQVHNNAAGRNYTFALAYDERGNVVRKKQVDTLGKKEVGRIDFERTYEADGPHQASRTADENFAYDADGNLTSITTNTNNGGTSLLRELSWDAAGRMTLLVEHDGKGPGQGGAETTTYRYDGSNELAIERGPAGETAFVNRWVTVRNGNEMFKHVWIDDERIATQRDDGDQEEVKRYFLHKDLQGSTNMVTDATGRTFQHHEYFPTGKTWIDEHNTVFRTPYQYGGGYVDEQRHIIDFGLRWYDQDRELFHSVDPILTSDPEELIGTPELSPAYSYAGSNPITYVDPGGARFVFAKPHHEAYDVQQLQKQYAADGLVQYNMLKQAGKHGKRLDYAFTTGARLAELSDKWGSKPLVAINRDTGEVSLSFGMGPQKVVRKGKDDAGATGQPSAQTSQQAPTQDATGAAGGPNATNGQAAQSGGTTAQPPSQPGGDSGSTAGGSSGTSPPSGTGGGGAGGTNPPAKSQTHDTKGSGE